MAEHSHYCEQCQRNWICLSLACRLLDPDSTLKRKTGEGRSCDPALLLDPPNRYTDGTGKPCVAHLTTELPVFPATPAVLIRSRLVDTDAEFSEPWACTEVRLTMLPREGEQFCIPDEGRPNGPPRAFRVTQVEWYYGAAPGGGDAVHLYCVEYPAQPPPTDCGEGHC